MTKRKYESLDIVKMYSTLTLETWKSCLLRATKSGNTDKLVSYRYGLQSGLSDAVKKGISSDKLTLWVIKRCRDVEKCMRYVLRKQYPMPGDVVSKTHKGIRKDFAMDAIAAKKKRDLEFERFLQKSSF